MSLFDFTKIPDDPTKLQDGGGERPSPGRGMAIITRWQEYSADSQGKAHEVDLEIVAWPNAQDVAKTHSERLYHEDKTGKGHPAKRLTCLAMAAGLFTADDVKQWKKAGAQPEIDMQQMVGRPIMIELIEVPSQTDPTKKYINIGNYGLGFWHIKDPRTKDWAKNQTIYNRMAAVVGDWITEEKPKPSASQSTGANPFAVGNV